MTTSEIRVIALHLKPGTETASERAITEALCGLQPVPSVLSAADHIRLEYVFPAIIVTDIFEALTAGNALAGIRFRSRLRGALAGMLEETERERRGRRLGWHAYVDNAYAHYFARRAAARPDARRQHWQDYGKAARGGAGSPAAGHSPILTDHE